MRVIPFVRPLIASFTLGTCLLIISFILGLKFKKLANN